MVFCFGCENYLIDNERDILEFENYCERSFKYYYKFKRYKEVLDLMKEFERMALKVFKEKCGLTLKDAKNKINIIKKNTRISLKEI